MHNLMDKQTVTTMRRLFYNWRFHFYKISGVIPEPTDTIETAWARLSVQSLWSATAWLGPMDLYAWMALHYKFTRFARCRPQKRSRYPRPRITADELRELLPVPDARDLEIAVDEPQNPPWVFTPRARREVNRAEKRKGAR